MVNAGQINKTTTLCLTIEEEWSHTTTEDHDLRYIKRILFGLEEIQIDPKGYAKPFQQGHMYQDNGLILCHYTPQISRVEHRSLRVPPKFFRQVGMSECRVYICYQSTAMESEYHLGYCHGFGGQRLIIRCIN